MKEVAIILIVFSIVCNVWISCRPVSYSSLQFVAFVLDNYRTTCQVSNGFSFQHGVVIKTDQRMLTSDTPCTPEEHTVDDVIIYGYRRCIMPMVYEEQLISQHVQQTQNCALHIQISSRNFKILEKR